MVETLHINLLGDFRLTYGKEEVSDFNSDRLQSLVAYLALNRGRLQSRQQLAFTFWPDSKEKQALTNLRNLIYHLRRSIPDADHFLNVESKTLVWKEDAPCVIDVAEFESLLAEANDAIQHADEERAQKTLERAVELYRGELLPGCFDDWLLPERERIHQACMKAMERLVHLLESSRVYALAIQYAQRLLQLDPVREPSYRLLMRLHALNGDRASALRAYHHCITILQRELGLDPEPETRELYERILNVELETIPTAITTTSPSRETLIGRRTEWKTLRDAWRTAADGKAMLVTITGEAGIGKSRLAQELWEWAQRQGIPSARTRSYAAEGRLAYAPVTDWLRSEALRPLLDELNQTWLVEISRILPELRTSRSGWADPEPLREHWQRQQLFEALARAFLSGSKPLLLILDDLQWCDQDTLEWLRYLLRYAPEARLLLLGTIRIEETEANPTLKSFLLDLERTGQVREVTLGPLDAAETAQLVEQASGRPLDAVQSRRIYEETEGNPLFVVECIRAGISDYRDRSSEPADLNFLSHSGKPQLPATVQAVIKQRLDQLSPNAKQLASLASAIGRAFIFEVLHKAGGLNEDDLVQALDELWRRRIVREQEGITYDFTHDKLREVAYAEISPTRKRLLHRRIAEALESVYTDDLDAASVQIATHFDLAGITDRAVTYYQRAAHVAQHVYANQEVVRLLQRALTLLRNLPANSTRDHLELELLTALGAPLVVLKSYSDPEVIRTYERARALCDRLDQPCGPPILRALAIAYGVEGDPERQLKLGNEMLALAEQEQEPMLLVEALYVVGDSHFWMGHFSKHREYLERAITFYIPDQHKAHVALYAQNPKVVALCRLAWTFWYLGLPDTARQLSLEALELARQLEHPHSLVYALNFAVQLSINLRDTHSAKIYARELQVRAREQEFLLWEKAAIQWNGWVRMAEGFLEEGIEELRNGISSLIELGVHLQLPYSYSLLAESYFRAQQLDKGLTTIEEGLSVSERTGDRFHLAELYRLRGELLLAKGQIAPAEESLLMALHVARQQETLALELRAAISLYRLALHSNQREDSKERLEACYHRFTQGFDTRDLKEACSLLGMDHPVTIPLSR